MNNDNSSLGERVGAVVQRLFSQRSITRSVCDRDSLIDAGLTSLDMVKLVILVEDEFDLTIPAGEMTPANFRSIVSISQLVSKLIGNA